MLAFGMQRACVARIERIDVFGELSFQRFLDAWRCFGDGRLLTGQRLVDRETFLEAALIDEVLLADRVDNQVLFAADQ